MKRRYYCPESSPYLVKDRKKSDEIICECFYPKNAAKIRKALNEMEERK